MERRLTPLMRHTVRQFRRDALIASDGPAGRVRDVYFEDEGWKVRYLVIQAGGWLLPSLVLVAPAAVDVQASGGLGLWGAVGNRSQADAERAAHAELARGATRGEVDDFIIDARTWTVSELIVDTRRWLPGGRVRFAAALVQSIDWRPPAASRLRRGLKLTSFTFHWVEKLLGVPRSLRT